MSESKFAPLEAKMAELLDQLEGLERSEVTNPSLRRYLMANVRFVLNDVRAKKEDPTLAPTPNDVQLVNDLYDFIMQDFPQLLSLPFQRFGLNVMYESGVHEVDNVYTYQNAWVAERLFHFRPEFFVDIGSMIPFVTIVSRLVPCIAIDARPTSMQLEGLLYRRGEAQSLPFEEGSIPAVTSLHAPEHFGLGRYGDTIDNRGTERAAAEFERVVEVGGWIFFSVPVAYTPTIVFNLERQYTPDLVRAMFPRCRVVDELFLGPDPVSQEELERRLAEQPDLRGGYVAMFERVE